MTPDAGATCELEPGCAGSKEHLSRRLLVGTHPATPMFGTQDWSTESQQHPVRPMEVIICEQNEDSLPIGLGAWAHKFIVSIRMNHN